MASLWVRVWQLYVHDYQLLYPCGPLRLPGSLSMICCAMFDTQVSFWRGIAAAWWGQFERWEHATTATFMQLPIILKCNFWLSAFWWLFILSFLGWVSLKHSYRWLKSGIRDNHGKYAKGSCIVLAVIYCIIQFELGILQLVAADSTSTRSRTQEYNMQMPLAPNAAARSVENTLAFGHA